MSDTNNIFSTGAGSGAADKLSEDTLLQYLEGTLTSAQQHEVEQWLAAEGMESDAIEGLQTLPSQETKHTISKLNRNLQKTLRQKKRRRRHPKTDSNTLIAIAVILMLAIIAYIVVRKAV